MFTNLRRIVVLCNETAGTFMPFTRSHSRISLSPTGSKAGEHRPGTEENSMPIRTLIQAGSGPLAGALLCLLAVSVAAHQSEPTPRYVDATQGVDRGDCAAPAEPCATIVYAVRQAQKGDQVRVATGSYPIDPADTASLLSDLIPVVGGYSTVSRFTVAQPDKQPPYVTGPSFEHRARLAERGLILLQDPKRIAIERSIRAGAAAMATPSEPTPRTNGQAGPYPCRNIDFLGHVALNQFTSKPTSANDIWGFVDNNDTRQTVLIRLRNGTAVVDVSDPAQPREVGTIAGRTSTWRDIKVYQLRDTHTQRWQAYAYVTSEDAVVAGRQPCKLYVDYNEDSVDIWGVTDKAAPVKLSSTSYQGSQHAHCGWPTADNRFVFIQDELDEVRNGHNSRLYTLDLGNLAAPVLSPVWTGPTGAIDHNGFIKGTRS